MTPSANYLALTQFATMNNPHGAYTAPNAGEIVRKAHPMPYFLILHIAGGPTQTTLRGSRWRRQWSRVVGLLAALLRKPSQAAPQVANTGAADLRPNNVYENPGAGLF